MRLVYGPSSALVLLQADEAKYIQDNKEGRLPIFLEEVGFAVQELPPRYKGVQFLLATKDAEAQEGGMA